VIANDIKRQWLYDTFQAIAVDMESAALAQIAFLNSTPWLAVRSISDTADSEIDFDMPSKIIYSDETPPTFTQKAQKRAGQVAQMAGAPRQFQRLLKFRQGLRQAAQQAAQVVAALVSGAADLDHFPES
ncbi:MAG: hypothetical protein AAF485_30345, partial [Chloroflexota bacterium]